MEMPQEDIDEALGSLLNRIIPAYQKNLLLKNDEHFWAARAALTFNKEKHIDRGIFSIYFFNLLNLHPGEAIFQDAGLPHAYLEGQNIEIMANSDNVLRGGLTSKHIDVRELMQHIKFEETVPEIIYGQKATEHELVFLTPAPDFELSLVILEQGETISSASSATEIFLLMEGEADVYENDKNRLLIKKGEAFVSFNEALIDIHALKKSVICKASVPS
jgi:mannose-6-phosphate isomerase